MTQPSDMPRSKEVIELEEKRRNDSTSDSQELLVSVLIPTYNRSSSLVKAVRSALAQDYASIEVLVFDNASTDNTEIEMKNLASVDQRLLYNKNAENIGPIRNWRRCLEAARGKYSVILCDDDYFIDLGYLRDGVRLLEVNNSKLLVPASILDFETISVKTLCLPEVVNGIDYFLHFWAGDYQIPSISCIFDTALAKDCHAFTNQDVLYSDIALWLKMMLSTVVVFRKTPAIYYHIHGANIVTAITLRMHERNMQFIGEVYEYARTTQLLSEACLDTWRRRMITHYVFQIVLGEVLQRGGAHGEFLAYASKTCNAVQMSRLDTRLLYVKRRLHDWLVRVVRQAARKLF